MIAGSDITLSSLAQFKNVRWISSGVTYWEDQSIANRPRQRPALATGSS
jgi:hypothetical protein